MNIFIFELTEVTRKNFFLLQGEAIAILIADAVTVTRLRFTENPRIVSRDIWRSTPTIGVLEVGASAAASHLLKPPTNVSYRREAGCPRATYIRGWIGTHYVLRLRRRTLSRTPLSSKSSALPYAGIVVGLVFSQGWQSRPGVKTYGKRHTAQKEQNTPPRLGGEAGSAPSLTGVNLVPLHGQREPFGKNPQPRPQEGAGWNVVCMEVGSTSQCEAGRPIDGLGVDAAAIDGMRLHPGITTPPRP